MLGMRYASNASGKQYAQTQTREKHYATAMRYENNTLEAKVMGAVAVGELVAQKQERCKAVYGQSDIWTRQE
jgi:hypothetical protein